MMESLKNQIKHNATNRRERAQPRNGDKRLDAFIVRFDSDLCEARNVLRCMNYQKASESVPSITVEDQPGLQLSHDITDQRLKEQPDKTRQNLFEKASDYEIDFIMKYLDYIFPFLFPFYRPSIFETGRSWLLSLLRQDRIVFHSALSLTYYFFTLALRDAYGGAYEDCENGAWIRLEDQIHKCFEIMQAEMNELNVHDKTATILDKAHVMGDVIQILMFEVVLGRLADWKLHLTAAVELFRQIFDGADQPDIPESKMTSALRGISQPFHYKVEFTHYIWNPEQAGFRFFAALLIYIDVIASTALAQPPRLGSHYLDLLDSQDNTAPILGFSRLRLSTIVGCQNSVIIAIGQISTLHAWKGSMAVDDSISAIEAAERAKMVSKSLIATLASLDSHGEVEKHQQPFSLPFESYAVRSGATGSTVTTTQIWAESAKLYLLTVVSGWQPSSSVIESGISRILELLKIVPSSHHHTLAWPICVAGCLASVHQEHYFRDLFVTKKQIELTGSLKEARLVMEGVWGIRLTIQADTWDLAACLNILGKPMLLI